ncbi:MAG TPA: YggT family protein, partial [Candidatus Acidoferrales bacterium]|nr:YggT family protein [Candidatus Acidoferrales bacterium]
GRRRARRRGTLAGAGPRNPLTGIDRLYAYTNLIFFVARTLEGLLQLYFWIVIISAVLTWIEPNPYNPIVRFIYSITEPIFDWIREHLPVIFGGIDFSPLVVILGISFLQQYLIPTLVQALTGMPT